MEGGLGTAGGGGGGMQAPAAERRSDPCLLPSGDRDHHVVAVTAMMCLSPPV